LTFVRKGDGSATDFRFRKTERIRKRRDISLVFSEGTRWSTKGMRLNVRPNDSQATRALFVTVKKYGNAVQRNRARRVVSECWRLAKSGIVKGLDVVVMIYPDEDTMQVRCLQLQAVLVKASLVA
jgi:ribonuclease P protein component